MPPMILIVGLLALAYGGVKLVRRASGLDVPNPPPLSATCPTGQDQCPPSDTGAAPPGITPTVGIASSPGYHWCHVVREGDNAGNIAKRVVGDSDRYLELLSANPKKPVEIVTDPKTGARELNFKIGALCVGERLNLPASWNPWMDQLGNARGMLAPFPPFNTMPEYPKLDPSGAGVGTFRGYKPGADFTWEKVS